jgi:hypothetical protein
MISVRCLTTCISITYVHLYINTCIFTSTKYIFVINRSITCIGIIIKVIDIIHILNPSTHVRFITSLRRRLIHDYTSNWSPCPEADYIQLVFNHRHFNAISTLKQRRVLNAGISTECQRWKLVVCQLGCYAVVTMLSTHTIQWLDLWFEIGVKQYVSLYHSILSTFIVSMCVIVQTSSMHVPNGNICACLLRKTAEHTIYI